MPCLSGAIFTVFTNMFSSDWERHLLLLNPYVYMCLLFGDLFIYSVRVSSFCFYFCVIYTLVLSLSKWFLSCYYTVFFLFLRMFIIFFCSFLSMKYFGELEAFKGFLKRVLELKIHTFMLYIVLYCIVLMGWSLLP